MPADSNIQLYSETLSWLSAIFDNCVQKGEVIIFGDFNAKLLKYKSNNAPSYTEKDMPFHEFRNKSGLVSICNTNVSPNIDFTYMTLRTIIDHVLIEKTFVKHCTKFSTVDNSAITTSDHLPVFVTVELPQTNRLSNSHVRNDYDRVAWNKGRDSELKEYNELMVHKLKPVFLKSYSTVNEISNFIVRQIMEASREVLPKSKFNIHAKPY